MGVTRKYNIIFPVFIFIVFTAIASVCLAEVFDDASQPWRIDANKISYDQKNDQYIAEGNVLIIKEDKKLAADFARFNHKTMDVAAKGHVIMTAGEDILSGSSMEVNLNTETGTIYNGSIFLKENHFYINGDKIQKLGKDTYAAENVSISTCDGDCPSWKITGKNLKVTIEGYGYVTHAALWAKKAPILYVPFFVFPAKTKRQSGLLPPQIGFSKRKWEEYIQPFYWAINESSDATFYIHHMERRGCKLGVEYRYILDSKSKGALMYDFLNDMKVEDGSLHSAQEWGYEDDNAVRTNADRYWFRMKHNQDMPFGFSAKLDLDIVSDQDYLHEFRDGYTGFHKTEEYFNENFGRELDEYDDSTRVNSLNFSKSWSQYNLNAEFRWYDNVINRRQDAEDTTLQKLPFVEFNASKQRILNSPFYFSVDSEYVNFFRKDGIRGHRFDAYSNFYLPISYKNYFAFEPSIGLRETIWNIYKHDDNFEQTDSAFNREIYDAKLDFSSKIFKIYSVNGKNIDKIKHAITPQIIYEYTPDQEQDEYPIFDSLDRIQENNILTYSITNTFTHRAKKPNDDKNNEPISYDYHQFCRFKLEQSYDINESKEDDSEPFSCVYAEIEATPSRYFSIRADAEWSQYENDFQSYNTAVSISDKRGDKVFVEHRYAQDSSESIYMNVLIGLSDNLSIRSAYERNIHDSQDIKTNFGFLYKSQCWSIDYSYTDEDDDRKHALIVNLYGLGEFGKTISGRTMETTF